MVLTEGGFLVTGSLIIIEIMKDTVLNESLVFNHAFIYLLEMGL